MAKVAMLVPTLELQKDAERLAQKYHLNLAAAEVMHTVEDAERRALELRDDGIDLFIARGLQGMVIHRATRLPVVPIRLNAQELGLLILKIKKQFADIRPQIAVIGMANMLCDMSHFPELFEVDVRPYLITDPEQYTGAVWQALQDGAQVMIGGNTVCRLAHERNIPSVFCSSGPESLDDAFRHAEQIAYAIDLEKKNTTETKVLLDYSFNGIVRVRADGTIRKINHFVENMLKKREADIIGRPVREVIPALDKDMLHQALVQGDETYSVTLNINHSAMITNVAPVLLDGKIDGAIITFHEGQRIRNMEAEMRRELYRHGFVAKYSFKDLVCESEEMRQFIAQCKSIAKYSTPVLMMGEAGTEKEIFAHCIHNESMNRSNSFVNIDCSAWPPEKLDKMLFGGNPSGEEGHPLCYVELAENGTLFLDHIESLSLETQYKLYRLTLGQFLQNGESYPQLAHVRMIASASSALLPRVMQGTFRSDLFYALSVLSLEVPPLRHCREDIRPLADQYLDEFQQKYSRYVHLTQGAYQFMENYKWGGNQQQLRSICERVVLLSLHRNVDEIFVRRQLEQAYPDLPKEQEPGQTVVFKDKKAAEISQVLKKHGGNREKAAAELGISKTTLWRYMKKYEISTDFSY